MATAIWTVPTLGPGKPSSRLRNAAAESVAVVNPLLTTTGHDRPDGMVGIRRPAEHGEQPPPVRRKNFKIKAFIEQELFDQEVALADANALRNLSEPEATRTLVETMKAGVNALTVQDRGTTELRHQIKLSETRPFLIKDQRFIAPRKSIFNKVTGDNDFELKFAAFLKGCSDIVSFAKNSQSTRFRIEYRNVDGSIANYYPDFIVKQTERDVWIIETKGREDVHDSAKWERLQQWCADATTLDAERAYRPLFVSQEDWESYRPRDFEALTMAFRIR